MITSDFDYELPPECIAQTPVEPRDVARLLVLDRKSGRLQHHHFYDLDQLLNPGDLLVLNETRVIPARLFASKVPGGGRVELLLLHPLGGNDWQALVGGKGLDPGRRLQVEDGPLAEVLAVLDGAQRIVRFAEPIEGFFGRAGHVPLPPYIHTPLADPERYQTIYSRQPGSAAAPTAGLHFTSALFERLAARGVRHVKVTLHVGLDTFAPVTEQVPDQHKLHSEWCQVTPGAVALIKQVHARGGRIIAVGTTSVRSLETAAQHAPPGGWIAPWEGPTSLYILPGYTFKVVDAMITNFHLPRSTLIMLVSAFAGRQTVLDAYAAARDTGYRFYSFGDGMLIL